MIDIRNTSPKCSCAVVINYCIFTHNHIQKVVSDSIDQGEQWRRLVYLYIQDTIISSNTHDNGNSLISLNNGLLFLKNCSIANNSYYKNIVILSLSCMKITGHIYIMKNHARCIINTNEFAYVFFYDESRLIISQNTVYTVVAAEMSHKT